ncbi:MAG: leucine-rich repeat domain-containing protein [Chlamydiota bacterium]
MLHLFAFSLATDLAKNQLDNARLSQANKEVESFLKSNNTEIPHTSHTSSESDRMKVLLDKIISITDATSDEKTVNNITGFLQKVNRDNHIDSTSCSRVFERTINQAFRKSGSLLEERQLNHLRELPLEELRRRSPEEIDEVLDLEEWRTKAAGHGARDGTDTATKEILSCFKNSSSRLDLEGLNLTYFPSRILRYFPQLESINISRNSIKTISIPPVMTNLKTIDLSNCDLTSAEIPLLPNLKKLNIGGNKLETITLSPSLEEVQLDYNKFKGVDLSKMQNLKSISLMGNDLESVKLPSPAHKLERVYLSYNKLESIDLSKIPKKTNIDLSHNQFTKRPQAICDIDLRDNPLQAKNPSKKRKLN